MWWMNCTWKVNVISKIIMKTKIQYATHLCQHIKYISGSYCLRWRQNRLLLLFILLRFSVQVVWNGSVFTMRMDWLLHFANVVEFEFIFFSNNKFEIWILNPKRIFNFNYNEIALKIILLPINIVLKMQTTNLYYKNKKWIRY